MATIPWESDHHAIICDSYIRPVYMKNKPRKIYQYSKANWTNMRSETEDFVEDFIPKSMNRSVEECWTNIKSHICAIIDKHVPYKMTSRRQHLQWISQELRWNTKRRHRMYNKAKRSGKTEHKKHTRRTRPSDRRTSALRTVTLLPTLSLKASRATTNGPSGSTSKSNARTPSAYCPWSKAAPYSQTVKLRPISCSESSNRYHQGIPLLIASWHDRPQDSKYSPLDHPTGRSGTATQGTKTEKSLRPR